jgi:hypothetical protein
MPRILHRQIGWLVALAVPMGAFCAPFLHAHLDEEDHHRAAVHTHFSGHEREHHDLGGVSLQEPEHDRAIYLQAYMAVQTAIFDIPVAPPPEFDTTAPRERTAHPTVEVTHGHDPPLLPALDSRPPPLSFLS